MLTSRHNERRGNSAMAETPDWSCLMSRAQQGDREAYRRMLTEIASYLRAVARRSGVAPADIEDAVQDILLTIHTIRHTYDPHRPFGPWLVTIARRRIIDRLRHHQRRAAVEEAFEKTRETFAMGGANFHEAAVESDGLRRAIECLPVSQRRAIVLLKLREMSLKEAARESGMTVTSLKVAAHRGVLALRKMLGRRSPT